MIIYKSNLTAIALATAAVFGTFGAFAAELPEGTVISKDNVDKIKLDTFEGKTIGSLLTDKIAYQIKNFNLKLPLVHSKPVKVDPKFTEMTKKYSAGVKFDPATREVSGWTAGLPFPTISESDPYAGDKLIWNFYLATQVDGSDLQNKVAFLYIDGKKGLDKMMELVYTRVYFAGRLDSDKPVIGDDNVLSKTLLSFIFPYDARGLSTLTTHYNSPKLDDSFLYVKSMRRTRRLSGNNLLDSIGSSDILQDDVNLWNARPSWYPKIKLVGKRWILAMAHGKKAIWDKSKNGTPEAFPQIDLKNAPYWNPVEVWEPREVYVVEAEAPAEHVYGKKILYMDADLNTNLVWLYEVYDKKGEFWKFGYSGITEDVGKQSGVKYRHLSWQAIIDFKAMHATSPYIYDWKLDSGLKPSDVSLEKLESDAK